MTPSEWVKLTDIEKEEYKDSEEGQMALAYAALEMCPHHFCPKCGQPIRDGYDHNPIYCIGGEREGV